MSAETKTAIEDAIRAHIADEAGNNGQLLVSWVVLAAAAVPDEVESTAYWHEHPTQPIHTTLGLIDTVRHYVRAELDTDDD